MLITRLAIDSGTRPGPLNNGTLQDYESAASEDGIKVILVAKHKRAKDGPAIVPILPDLAEKRAFDWVTVSLMLTCAN